MSVLIFGSPAWAQSRADIIEGATDWVIPEGAPTAPPAGGGAATEATVADPMGDTFGMGMPQLDISSFSASTDGTDLFLRLEFSTAISPSDSGMADAMVGFIDIDTDQDPMTGGLAANDIFCPQPAGIGVEFFVNLGSYNGGTGQMQVAEGVMGMTVGTADAVFSPMAVDITVPLATLGADDGIADAATVLGTFAEPTDCAPNGGALTSDLMVTGDAEIPTLGPWGLALLGLLLLAAASWMLRRRATV